MIGTFYSACIDEVGSDALGAQPIAPLLAPAGTVKDVPSIVGVMTELHAKGDRAAFSCAPPPPDQSCSVW